MRGPVLAPVREIDRALLAAVVPAGRSGQDFDRQGRAPQLFPGAQTPGVGPEPDSDVRLEDGAASVEHVDAGPDAPQSVGVDVRAQRDRETRDQGLVHGQGRRRHDELAVEQLVAVAVLGEPLPHPERVAALRLDHAHNIGSAERPSQRWYGAMGKR